MMSLLPPARMGSRRAFSLVLTLIIITMLAVVVVGFLSSMSTERTTADAFANKARADQAAQAGVDSAMATLRQAFRDFPDSATVWEKQSASDDGTQNDGTSLYVHAVPDSNNASQPDPLAAGSGNGAQNLNSPNNVTASGSDARQTFVLPLTSGAAWKPLATYLSNPVTLAAKDDVAPNLNVRRNAADTQGLIGSPPDYTGTGPKPTRVPWVEISQPDGYAAPSNGPVVARYAFWMEDESFKANINYAGLGSDPTNPVRRDNTLNASLNATDTDLRAPLKLLGDSNATVDAQSLLSTRKLYPSLLFPDSLAFSHAPQLASQSALTDKLRFVTTTLSGALNLSRHGTQRLNLNELMYPATAGTYSIQNQIDNIVGAIKYLAPNFCQRFYRTTTAATPAVLNALTVKRDDGSNPPTSNKDHGKIYFYKVAANILDYMDADSRPTFVDGGGQVVNGNVTGNFAKFLAFDPGISPNWAQGKESSPYLEEGGVRYRGGPSANGQTYELKVDYYLEFWNMTGRDIAATALGPIPRIRIANPPPWIADYIDSKGKSSTHETYLYSTDAIPNDESPTDTRQYPPPVGPVRGQLRDYDVDLASVVFKAGTATVVTTDPDYKDIVDTASQANTYVCPFYAPDPTKRSGKRVYKGLMPTAAADATNPPTRCTRLRIPLTGYTTTTSSDYETSIAFYTTLGYIDCLEGAIPQAGSPIFITPTGVSAPILFGGSLHGNSGNNPCITGDPRSNNEQMVYTLYASGGSVDQSRYFNFTYVNNLGATDASLGRPNANFTIPDSAASGYTPWADYHHFAAPYNASNAPAVIANAPLTSIGQLGDVYDPARIISSSTSSVVPNDVYVASRGGGRTFKIGQHDDRWDGDPMSASRTWASWRLADIFCAPPPSATGIAAAGPFPDVMSQPGLININGVARDDGAALRAALTGFNYQPSALASGQSPSIFYPLGDPVLAGTSINTSSTDVTATGIEAMITEIKQRLKTAPGNLGPDQYSAVETYLPKNTGSGPFFERGEISELTQFGRNAPPTTFPPTTAYSATKLTGKDLAQVDDRGREELFRRLVDMTTTRGNVFTVYAIGQSINQPNTTKPKVVTSTQRLRVTFCLMPKTKDNLDFHPATSTSGLPVKFDLTQSADLTNRFMKPDHYDIQILSSSKSGG